MRFDLLPLENRDLTAREFRQQLRNRITSSAKANRRGSHGGLAPVLVPVNVLTPSTGRTERFTFRPSASSLQLAFLFLNLN
jgi:hypothetical protein